MSILINYIIFIIMALWFIFYDFINIKVIIILQCDFLLSIIFHIEFIFRLDTNPCESEICIANAKHSSLLWSFNCNYTYLILLQCYSSLELFHVIFVYIIRLVFKYWTHVGMYFDFFMRYLQLRFVDFV